MRLYHDGPGRARAALGDGRSSALMVGSDRHRLRDALLVAASRALHEHDGVRDPAATGWLRCRVAQMLDLPAATVEAEFTDDESLLTATIAWLTRVHVRRQRRLADLLATGDFSRWARAAVVQSRTPGPVFGCEIGRLAWQPDLAGVDRDLLDNAFCAWEWQLATALRGLQSRGLVHPDADLQCLATTMLSLLQGAYLTACRTRDLSAIEATFDAAARLVTGPPAR